VTPEPERSYEKSVFINCPYDPGFVDLFHSIVFTIVAHGFIPRSAKESEASADPRIERISRALFESKYSIHDLSRFTGEGVDNFARFNMPLELGIAIALRYAGRATGRVHNWQVLVAGGYAYQRFASDLAGFDPSMHDMTVASMVRVVSSWLRRQPDASNPAPSARAVLAAHDEFRLQIEHLRREALDDSIWPDILLAAYRTAPHL
jgi:hypothetical protein